MWRKRRCLPLKSDVAKKSGKKTKKRVQGAKRTVPVQECSAGPAPLVSCCIIARNEAPRLPACLTSIAPLGAEVIVVDTGSDDGTPQLAERMGARVYHQPWRDDFSAPRNLAAQHARGAWILLLDADERLTPAGIRAMLVALAADDFDCGLLPLLNADRMDASIEEVVSGRATLDAPQLLPRLFRNVDGLAWEGIVHERPSAWFARAERRIKPLPEVPIAHYGAVPALRQALAKENRNLSLLEKQAALTPDDYRIREYLAYGLRDAGQPQRAAREIATVFEQVCAVLRVGAQTPRPSIVACTTLHANFLREAGALGQALSALDEAIGLSRGSEEEHHPNLRFQRGLCHELIALRLSEGDERDAQIEAARLDYEACLAQRGVLFAAQVNPAGCVAEVGCKRLGTLALMGRDGARATRWFEEAQRLSAMEPEIALGLSEAALLCGDFRACLSGLKPVLAMEQADAMTLAALCCEAGGEASTCQDLALKALRAFKAHGFLAPHRRPQLAALAHRLQARAAS